MTEVAIEFEKVENPTKLSELTKAHHVGVHFTHENRKGYFAFCGVPETGLFESSEEPKVRLLSSEEGEGVCNKSFNNNQEYSYLGDAFTYLRDELKGSLKVYVFKTRKELYRWLSE